MKIMDQASQEHTEELLATAIRLRNELGEYDDQYLDADVTKALDDAYFELDWLKSECVDSLGGQ